MAVAHDTTESIPHSDHETPLSTAKRATYKHWTKEEDAMLVEAVQHHNSKNWEGTSTWFSDRTAIQCLHRWHKALNPEIIKTGWTKEEDDRLIEIVGKHGTKKWSFIAGHLSVSSETM